jgi:hypothetical protein
MPAQTMAPERKTAVEPETVLRRQSLRRSLRDPRLLEEFLINSADVAKRHGMSLSDDEVSRIRQASHFLASWDLFFGGGRWLEGVLPDGGVDRGEGVEPAAELAIQAVRTRIAEEILRDIPAAIRRVTDHIGPDALTDHELDGEIPPPMRPVARTFRSLARNVARQVNRELSVLSLQAGLARATTLQPPPVPAAQPQPGVQVSPDAATQQLAGAISMYLTEAVNRAVQEALQRTSPRAQGASAGLGVTTAHEPMRERISV